jgi:hypothetical protein
MMAKERDRCSIIFELASHNFVIAKHFRDFKSRRKTNGSMTWTDCLEGMVIDLVSENEKLVSNLIDRKISTRRHHIESSVPEIHIRKGVIVEKKGIGKWLRAIISR